jgi:hypothetical protein
MKKILMLLLAVSALNIFAQRTITGIVTDEKGETIVGAAVRVLGITKGTLTDIDGKYSIQVSEKDAFLSFSFAGMQTVNTPIGSSDMITAALKQTTLPECIITGYGTIKICCHLRGIIIYTPTAQYTTQTEQSTLTINVLGNPFKDRFILNIQSEEVTNAVVSLRSIDGKLVKSFESNLLKGDNQIDMADLGELISGVYTVSVTLKVQNDLPTITDKLTTVDLPNRFYNKIMAAHPEFKKDRFKGAIPLSKEQYELIVRAGKLKENINKLRATILNSDPEFDSWEVDEDGYVMSDDEALYATYKEQMSQLLNEYRAILTNPIFEGNDTKAYSLEDFDSRHNWDIYNVLLVKRKVIVKKMVYTKVVVKM